MLYAQSRGSTFFSSSYPILFLSRMPTQRKNNDLTFLPNVSKYLTHFFQVLGIARMFLLCDHVVVVVKSGSSLSWIMQIRNKIVRCYLSVVMQRKNKLKSLTLVSNALYFLYVLEDSQSQRKTACTEMRSNTCTHKSFVTSFWPASETNFHCSSSKSYSPFMI